MIAEKTYKKIKYIIAIVILLLILVAGVWKNNIGSQAVIRIGVFAGNPWDGPSPYTYELFDSAIAKFEEEHPGVKVEYVSGIEKEDYSEWLASKIIEGDAPDVFMVLPTDFSILQESGSLLSLDKLIQGDSSFDRDKFYEGAYDSGTYNKSQYALPLESAPDMMFVNKTLLQKENISIPDENWTWAQLYSICKKVTKDTDGNGVIDQFGIYNYNWEHAFITSGNKLFDEKGSSCNIQGVRTQDAVGFIKRLETLKGGAVVTSADFDQGKVAFMPLTLADYRAYKPYPWSIKKFSTFEWECIPLPRGTSGENISCMNTLLMGINSRTNSKSLSWDLMKTFCYDESIQFDIYKYRSGGAVLKNILNDKDVLLLENQALPQNSSINVEMIKRIMEKGVADFTFEKSGAAKAMIHQGIQDIIDNDKNPQIALKNIQREVNKFLSE